MYSLINNHIDALLHSFECRYVEEYQRLLACHPEDKEYQRQYKNTWMLNRIALSDRQWQIYFDEMQMLLNNQPKEQNAWFEYISNLAKILHMEKTNRGQNTLPFAACTKLVHTINHTLPIYDSKVAAFYLWKPPASNKSFEERIESFLTFYKGLVKEYERIIRNQILDKAIQKFQQRFDKQESCTKEKVVDFLIWHWVRFCGDQFLVGGDIHYS